MASTATLDTFSAAVDTLKVEFIDYNNKIRTPSYQIILGLVSADVAALVDLLDPITHCRICEVMINTSDYIVTGAQAADNAAHWYEIYQQVVLSFRSQSRCRVTVQVVIPGPVDAIFTGQDKILVDPAQAAIAAVITWFEGHLKYKSYGGLTDFKFEGGERQQIELPTPTVH